MRSTPSHSSRRLAALAAVATALLCLLPARRAQAQRRRVAVVYVPVYYNNRPTYIERPLTTERRHIDLDAGLAYEYADYFRRSSYFGRSLSGAATHAEIRAGVADILEIGGGFGLRFNDDARWLNTSRLGRVDHEWFPNEQHRYVDLGGGRVAPVDRSLGNDLATNPYLKLRVAFVNRAPFMIGLEGFHNLPIVNGTNFVFGLGLPMHIIASGSVRFETGIFTQFMPNGNSDEFPLQIPFRVNFQVTPRLWLGLRTGLEMNYGFLRYGGGQRFTSPAMFQGGVRIVPRFDLTWHIGFPEFIHNDPYTNRNVFFDRFGAGVGFLVRLL